jgi:oligopeptidase B
LAHEGACCAAEMASALAFGAASVLVLGGAARRARRLHGAAGAPPKAKVQGSYVRIGFVAGENRGESPMRPPKVVYDPYYWLRDDSRSDPEVLAHLRAENEYAASHLDRLKPLAQELYADFLSHIQQTDTTPAYSSGAFMYYSRTLEGSSYKIYCRKAKLSGGALGPEQVLLDMNEVAKGRKHCNLGELAPSPDHSLLAYTLDETGYESFTTYVLELGSGKLLPLSLPLSTGNVVWGADNATLFYETLDEAHRPHKAWLHRMGTPAAQDVCLFEEADEEFNLGMSKTRSGRFLLLQSATSETSEWHVLDLQQLQKQPQAAPVLAAVQPRETGVRYSMDHQGAHFWIVTNLGGAKNQKLMRAPVATPGRAHWAEVLPYEPRRMLEVVHCFAGAVVLEGREGGMTAVWTLDPAAGGKPALSKVGPFPEPVSFVQVSHTNRDFDAPCVRITYESLVTPQTTLDVDFSTGRRDEVHVRAVPNYDRAQYKSEQLFAKGHDGTMIPMSLVYKRGTAFEARSAPGPVFLDAYGSYGICNDPNFSSYFVSLLDRGVCVVLANIRGGSEMGREWYEDQGKLLNKRNTFLDFCSCAEHLSKAGLTAPERLAIHGRSAGGLLMGAVLNMAPHLFKCAVAAVPFVDVCTTMSDASIPLTTGEWTEWGQVNSQPYYDYMRSYCPVSNVTAQDYPNILVLAGLHDPRVAYWEPAKWVAKLRDLKTDSNVILLKTDLDSGHFSASDRYKYLREKSEEYAYVCDQIVATKLVK